MGLIGRFLGWVAEKVENGARAVKNFFFGDSKQAEQESSTTSGKISDTGSYNDYTTVRQVRDLQSILNEYLEIYRDEGKNAEQYCKDKVNKCFDAIIEKLREDNELAKSFGIDQLTRKKNNLCRDIDGAIVNAIREHLSTDDPDCRQILEMNSGAEKGRRMRKFVFKTIDDAKSDLAEKVSSTMKQINDELSDFLKGYVETQESSAQRAANQFQQWERDMNNKNFDSERAQLPARKKLYAIEQIEKVIAA